MDIAQIRQQAQDETTPAEILSQLATSEDRFTRQYVDGNANTPTKV